MTQPIVERYLARSAFGLLPLVPSVLDAQQHVADAFHRAGVIPRAIRVADIVHPLSCVR